MERQVSTGILDPVSQYGIHFNYGPKIKAVQVGSCHQVGLYLTLVIALRL